MANCIVTTLVDEVYDSGDLADATADGAGLSLREALAPASGQLTTSSDSTVSGNDANRMFSIAGGIRCLEHWRSRRATPTAVVPCMQE